jgi:predicted ester cyclase
MNTAFPDVRVTETDLITAGDRVVERSDVVGTHRADFMGVPATGKSVRWSEIHIYRLVAGKIAEHWVELAMLEIMQQIGAVPAKG